MGHPQNLKVRVPASDACAGADSAQMGQSEQYPRARDDGAHQGRVRCPEGPSLEPVGRLISASVVGPKGPTSLLQEWKTRSQTTCSKQQKKVLLRDLLDSPTFRPWIVSSLSNGLNNPADILANEDDQFFAVQALTDGSCHPVGNPERVFYRNYSDDS